MKIKKTLTLVIIFINVLCSCKKFIEIDAPRNSVIHKTAFESNDMAISTVLGIYQQMAAASSYASGGGSSISTICGLSADEFIGYSIQLKPVFEHQITPELSPTGFFWQNMYARIYDINSILEGLELPNGVTPPVKSQLRGEVLFLRAFHYFYLSNLFGSVPLYLTTDYQLNSKSTRFPIQDIYSQIIKDLKAAELLLGEAYVTTERVRPNKSAVQALLAKVYLYVNDWENAEKYSSLVIEKSITYKLPPLNDIFLSNSLEAIWQLMPAAASNTPAGNFLILNNGIAPNFVSLRPDFVQNAFETNDQRKASLISSIVANKVIYYYPIKYKIQSSTNVTEYYMVFRLAEQILIRAEARANQNNLSKSIEDLDEIRHRAGIVLIKDQEPNISKENLLGAILRERRVEFFSEWGERWFDLKRTGKSNIVLFPIKTNWKPEYTCYPIPKDETDRNKNIIQNDGY